MTTSRELTPQVVAEPVIANNEAQTTAKPDTTSFNLDQFFEKVKIGAMTGSLSTTMTFATTDRPLAHAIKASADATQPVYGIKWFLQQMCKGNFAPLWQNSLYVQAYRAHWQHPLKGYPVALLNSGLKNVVFFPAKYVCTYTLNNMSSNEQLANNYAAFLAGMMTIYLTSPLAVIKTRLMTD